MADKKKASKKADAAKPDTKKTDKKIIAVMGATGAQGGGLVRAILDDKTGGFAARAVTRDPNSDKAKALADAAHQVRAGNVDEVEALPKACEGAYGACCVAYYWEHRKPDVELAHARNMAQAAKPAGGRHVIWSTHEDTRQSIPLYDNR